MSVFDEHGSIHEAISQGRYKNRVPYERRSKDAEAWRAYQDEEARLTQKFRQELIEEDLGLHGAVADAVREQAWEEGHSGGLSDVANAAYTLADLAGKVVKAERARIEAALRAELAGPSTAWRETYLAFELDAAIRRVCAGDAAKATK